MSWWVLTYLDNYRPPHSLSVLAQTNNMDHAFMAWSTHKPSRQRVHKTVRGLHVFCGYRWIWDTPNIVEQSQPGGSYEHLFGPIPLAPTDHVWYYLFTLPGLYWPFCQTALIHVPPPEPPMPTARIFNSLDQLIPTGVPTPISYDSVLWDDYSLYDPAQPTRLTIPAGALYQIGCCQHLSFPHDPGHRISILLNGTDTIVMHGHRSLWPNPPGSTTSLSTIMRFQPGDFLQVIVRHWAAGARNVSALPHYSPHFWIAQIGAYVI